jgi:hypothetical protein
VRSWHCGGYIKSTEKLLEDVKVPETDLLAEMSLRRPGRQRVGGSYISISTSIHSKGPLLASISIHSTRGCVDGNGMDCQSEGRPDRGLLVSLCVVAKCCSIYLIVGGLVLNIACRDGWPRSNEHLIFYLKERPELVSFTHVQSADRLGSRMLPAV